MNEKRGVFTKIFGALAGILLVYFVFFYRKKPFIRETGRFPFLWDRNTNMTVKHYLRANPANHILLVAGPYRSGKSRLLETVAEALLQEANLPIVVRADRAATLEDLVDQIKYDGIRALNALAPHLSQTQLKSLEAISLTSDESTVEFGSEGLSRVAQLLSRASDSLLAGNPQRFFEFMATLAVVVRPYVIVHGFEQFETLTDKNATVSGSTIVNLSLTHVLQRRQYATFVPLIVEIKDTSIFVDHELDEAFQVAYTGELENPLEQVNVIRSLFTKEEAKELVHEFGGHYGSFETVFEEMKMGTPINGIVREINERLDQEIETLMTNRTSEWWRWLNTLRPISREVIGVPEVREMIRRGYLWVNRTGYLFCASGQVRKRILDLAEAPNFNVKEFQKQEMEMLGREFVNETVDSTNETTETNETEAGSSDEKATANEAETVAEDAEATETETVTNETETAANETEAMTNDGEVNATESEPEGTETTAPEVKEEK